MPRSSKGRPAQGGEEVRLQAYLARAGVASRRASEELIAQGRVYVNGASVTAPGTKVRPGIDRVEVDGEPVEAQPTTWVALHKPRGYVTTRHDPYGRRTVYDLLPDKYHGLFHVGRLDRDSEGILLLTNDGETANRMLHPSHGVTKEYLADVQGKPAADTLRALVEGVELEDGVAHAESAKRLHQVDENVFRVGLVLREGKKREVRRMLDAVGHPVKRLIRKRFGPVELGELPAGKWRVVLPVELGDVSRGKKAPKPKPAPAASEGDEAGSSESRHRASTHGRYSPAAKSASKSGRKPASKSGSKSGAKSGARAGGKTGGRSGIREDARSDRPAGAKAGSKSGSRRPSKFTPAPGPRSGARGGSKSTGSAGSTESRSRSTDRGGSDRPRSDRAGSDRPTASDRSRSSDRARSDRPDRPRRGGDRE